MMKKLLRFPSILIITLLALSITACTEENTTTTTEAIEDFTEEVVYRMQEEGNCGRFGCYEFVFPINISFPDGSTAEVNSYEELESAIGTWREDNPDSEDRPELGFPLDVMSEDGEIITVNDRQELRSLARECRRDFFGRRGPRGHRNRGYRCFEVVFPVTLSFPDGSTADAADRQNLKTLARDWKANNPDSEERPTIVFPIDVELEDGTIQSVESQEDLRALKETCSQD